jgi:hypothetical protein
MQRAIFSAVSIIRSANVRASLSGYSIRLGGELKDRTWAAKIVQSIQTHPITIGK